MVASLTLILLVPAAALAHARLKSSSPAAGAHLASVPRELRLDFSEVPELTFTSIQLLDPSGREVALSRLTYAADSKRSVIATIRGTLVSGDYTVVWQVAGDDGHPVRDRFRLVIAPGVARTDAVDTSSRHHNPVSMPEGNEFGAESPSYVLVRWAAFMALLAAIGAVAFRQLVLRFLRMKEEPDSSALGDMGGRAARIGYRAMVLFLVVLLLRLMAQSLAMHGRERAFDLGLVVPMLVRTSWGLGWILQLLGGCVAGVGLYRVNTADSLSVRARRGWLAASVGVAIVAFTSGFAGHAGGAPRFQTLAVIADGFHLLGAGGWLGSLAIVLLAGIPSALALPSEERGPMVAELVNAFSPTALTFAGLVAATGVFAAWLHLGSIPAIWQSGYGRILLLKLAVLSVVGATGAYNWLRVKPTLGQIEGAARIRRSATVEIVVGIIVLLVTAILVATPTAMDMTM